MKCNHIILIAAVVLFLVIVCRTGVSFYKAKDRCQEFKDKLAREVTTLSKRHATNNPSLRNKLLKYRDELKKDGRCNLSGRRAVGAIERNGREPDNCSMFNRYMKMKRNEFLNTRFGQDLKPKFCGR